MHTRAIGWIRSVALVFHIIRNGVIEDGSQNIHKRETLEAV